MTTPASFVLLFEEPVGSTLDMASGGAESVALGATDSAALVAGTMTKTGTREEPDNDRCSGGGIFTGTMTKTGRTEREERDSDAGNDVSAFPVRPAESMVSMGTQTFTKTAREEPDQDPWRGGGLVFPGTGGDEIASLGTQTRTDAREEADQDIEGPWGESLIGRSGRDGPEVGP
ncbi:hypothetical protein LXT21_44320 [Myxococcus sp. K38C18041901]|uniref:hypothetical protein n=1 Tax=Myxococcus guangdongensis TaxID=2906760 RepID=UPI0020A77E5B|nr:hypothetical protein [Myxococcus guangdongensis]MCP3065816.1 hypothetical protein [Myxococcus guangdongensis]